MKLQLLSSSTNAAINPSGKINMHKRNMSVYAPVSDDTGLTGSVIHAIPFFLNEKTNRAIFIQSEKVAYDLGEPAKPPALFRFNDSDGGTQKIQAIKIDQKTQTMSIEGFYETQVGGGKFLLRVKINKDTLILAEFRKLPDKNK